MLGASTAIVKLPSAPRFTERSGFVNSPCTGEVFPLELMFGETALKLRVGMYTLAIPAYALE